MHPWVLWQLSDSAFPAGSFAHSGGLESAWRQGLVSDLASLTIHIQCLVQQAAEGVAPLCLMAHRDASNYLAADRLCDLVLNNAVANRASRSQGQGFALAVRRIFNDPALTAFFTHGRDDRAEEIRGGEIRGGDGRSGDRRSGDTRAGDENAPGHLPPLFGAVTRLLGVDEETCGRLFLFVNLRGWLSAAVRLGVVGPLAAQSLQHQLAPFAEAMAARAMTIPPDDVAQTAPLADLAQSCQDRLYSRLFQS